MAYQTLVLKELYPDHEINSYLLLPDKTKRTNIEGLAGWFRINKMIEEKFEMEELPAQKIPKFKKPQVDFIYENHSEREHYLNLLRNDNLLTLVPVNEEINKIIKFTKASAEMYLDILANGITPGEDYVLNKDCKSCEFNLGNKIEGNGYRECWKELTDIKPHIFDLYSGGSLKVDSINFYLDVLIDQKKVSFWDLDPERFKDSKGVYGSRGQRQLLQYEMTKENTEFISPDMTKALKDLSYPLHFIDFETYSGAIPHHKGMRPYEKVAFQWSCHTITHPDKEPIHSEFLNCDFAFPNFRFAESLMEQIGTSGTPLMWSSYENTILRDILKQMDIFNYENEKLKNWLTDITTDKGQSRIGRFVDLNELALRYYFHPDMKGKTSIKKVLPAIWNNNPYLHKISWFKKYVSSSEIILNPYDTLAPIINEMENEEVVKDGTGAMKAYHDLMFGEYDESKQDQLKKLLLQYCELDTMAMVIIWKYWFDKCNEFN